MYRAEVYTEEMPKGLVGIDEVSVYVGVKKERLLSLVEAGFVPHWKIDGGDPQFMKNEVKKWVAKNLMVRVEGKDIHNIVLINTRDIGKEYPSPPECLSQMKDLLPVSVMMPMIGVYFLCYSGAVVYIGQSTDIHTRVKTHITEKKIRFDTAYCMSIRKEELNRVENEYINALKPIFNYRGNEISLGAMITPEEQERLDAERDEQAKSVVARIEQVFPR